MRILLVVAFAACSKAGGAPPDFVNGKYPGFTLDVPRQLGSPPPTADYRSSDKQLRTKREVYSVSWNAGSLPAPELEAGFVAMIAAEVAPKKIRATKRVRVGTSDALRFDVAMTGDDFWSIVAVPCGERLVRVMVHARANGEATLQRMLSTFACTPDPAKERAIADAAPVGLDDTKLLAGWRREPTPGTYTVTDGTHVLGFVKGTELADLDRMQAMVANWKFGKRSEEGGRHFVDFSSGDATGTLAYWACGPNSGVVAMAVNYPPADARTLLGKFRCAKPGDKPLL